MSFMRSLADLIKNPKENNQLLKIIGLSIFAITIIFIAINVSVIIKLIIIAISALYLLITKKSLDKIFSLAMIITLVIFGLATMLFVDDIIRVFLVTTGALYLFTTEKLPVDLTALVIMVTLMVFGLVTPPEGVSGFSNSATITVLAMFILSAAIQRTGIIHTLGRYIFRFAGNSEIRQLLMISIIIGPISGFINNTAAVAIMLPMILDLAKRAKTSATKLLIPLSFVAMAGGTLTLIGTSTNILASSILENPGSNEMEMFLINNDFRSISMFEFFNLGLIVMGVVIVFFILFGKWLLPDRKNIENEKDNNEFLAEIQIQKGSNLIGKTLKKSDFIGKNEAKLVKIIRGEQSFKKDAEEKELQKGDIIVLSANEQRIIDIDKNEKNGIKLLLDFNETRRRLPGGQIAKVLVRSSSTFHKRSLSEINFWKRFSAVVVGIQREDVTSKRLASMKLETGEILLIKASKTNLKEIKKSGDFVVLNTIEEEYNREKMWLALGIITAVIAVAALGLMSIMVTALVGVILMIITGCLEPEDLHTSVSWDVIFLLAGVIPLGIAMQSSGAADLVAGTLAKAGNFLMDSNLFSGDFMPSLILLIFFYLFTTILTNIISNNASVVLIIPLALSVAQQLDLNPKAFVFAVIFAASNSFLTPIGYQTNTMVYGAGNYKFSDFIKVGTPLTILLTILTPVLIAYIWGF